MTKTYYFRPEISGVAATPQMSNTKVSAENKQSKTIQFQITSKGKTESYRLVKTGTRKYGKTGEKPERLDVYTVFCGSKKVRTFSGRNAVQDFQKIATQLEAKADSFTWIQK